jgi:hypothetical protein
MGSQKAYWLFVPAQASHLALVNTNERIFQLETEKKKQKTKKLMSYRFATRSRDNEHDSAHLTSPRAKKCPRKWAAKVQMARVCSYQRP